MANLNIRKLPDKAYKKIRELAKQNRRSINGEVIYILNEHLGIIEVPQKKEPELFLEIMKLRELSKGMKKTDSVKLIREMREKD